MANQTKPKKAFPQDAMLSRLLHLQFSFAPAKILSSALRLKLFSHIAAGHHTAKAIARAAHTDERGTRMELDALVALDLLSKRDGTYRLTPLASRYLVRESPDYFGSMLEQDALWNAWTPLASVLRTGRPYHRVEQRKKAESFFPALVRSLHIMNRGPAHRVAELLGAGKTRHGLRVLDVACGSGVWGIAVAEADSTARVVAHDFPGVLATTRQYVRRHGVTKQFEFLPGDLRAVDFGQRNFDVALLGNIVHSEGERSSRELLKRLHQALKPGGCVVIIDMIPNDQRTGPAFPIFFALNMLVNTTQGDTYTLSEYKQWFAAAGFRQVRSVEIGSHSPVIIAMRN
jgi:ubiquinone/menaquinone biosynthesis C-methylase UbiE